jgi:hypothetical protein
MKRTALRSGRKGHISVIEEEEKPIKTKHFGNNFTV